jgi:hypothetical protein
MSQRRISRRLIGVSLGLALLAATPAFAATQPASTTPPAAAGLEISPALVELNGDPGKSYVLKEKVTNVTVNDLNYSTTVSDFAAKDETGTPKLLPVGGLPSTASMINWIKVPNNFNLASMQSSNLTITVNIPANAEPGGHYGAVEFQGSNPNINGNSVGVKLSTGLLILTRVAGNINENMTLASLTAEKSGHQSSVFDSAPITFVTRLQNSGNIHVQPTGTITVTDIFGKLVGTTKVNSGSSNVLPNSIRRFESTFNPGWLFGRYTADLTIGYGTKGQVIQGQITFWVIPWKIVATALVILITLIFIIWQLLRANNKRVIRKYKKANEQAKKH